MVKCHFSVRQIMKDNIFIGRKQELADLRLLKIKSMASLVVIKGRRRIGKSRLIEEFAKGSRFIRFEGIAPTRTTTAQDQREEFARQMQKQLGIPGLHLIRDWGDLFTILAETIKNEKVIVLFDEITWMGSKDSLFLGKLKIVWDQIFSKNPHLMLILCGSLSAWIEKNIVSSTGFFGRISLKITLPELSLSECEELLRSRKFKGSTQELFLFLTVTGGVPWYLEQYNAALPMNENIRKLCFEPDGIFVEDFKYIFHDLFGKRSSICKKIVASLKDLSKTNEEIASAIQYSSGGPLSEYLEDLIISGFLEREHTWSIVSGEELKLSKYRIKDNYLRYYLKFIYPHLKKIKKGLFKKMSPFRLPGWEGTMGLQFENLVLNNRPILWKKLNIDAEDIVFENPFFQSKTSKKEGCQIDYMIQTRFKTLYIFEVKFSQHAISTEVIKEVKAKQKALKIPKGFACLPVLIHTNGITKALQESDYFTSIIDLGESVTG